MHHAESLFQPGAGFFLIAGPCVLEDESTNLSVAEEIARVGELFSTPVIFKASFDKANRSSINSARGPGLDTGLRLLEQVKSRWSDGDDGHPPSRTGGRSGRGRRRLADSSLPLQADGSGRRGRKYGPADNLKKGQWMAPQDMANQVQKARDGGAAAWP